MSEKPTIYELMAKVMAAVQAVGKDSRNNEQGYSFRGIDAVVNAAGPRLREFGVIPVPVLQESSWRDVRTSRDKPARECTVKVAYRFYGPLGDHIEAVVPGESMDFGDKGAAKAMSVAYRIALLQVLCIPTDDADPDSHSYERERDDWDAAQPANAGQAAKFDAFLKRIGEAVTADEVKPLGAEIHLARSANDISDVHYRRLAQAGTERLAELDKPAEAPKEES